MEDRGAIDGSVEAHPDFGVLPPPSEGQVAASDEQLGILLTREKHGFGVETVARRHCDGHDSVTDTQPIEQWGLVRERLGCTLRVREDRDGGMPASPERA